jgi:hypothetical protein
VGLEPLDCILQFFVSSELQEKEVMVQSVKFILFPSLILVLIMLILNNSNGVV